MPLVAPELRIEEVAATVVPLMAPVEATLGGVSAPAAVRVVPEKVSPPARVMAEGAAGEPVGLPRSEDAARLAIIEVVTRDAPMVSVVEPAELVTSPPVIAGRVAVGMVV